MFPLIIFQHFCSFTPTPFQPEHGPSCMQTATTTTTMTVTVALGSEWWSTTCPPLPSTFEIDGQNKIISPHLFERNLLLQTYGGGGMTLFLFVFLCKMRLMCVILFFFFLPPPLPTPFLSTLSLPLCCYLNAWTENDTLLTYSLKVNNVCSYTVSWKSQAHTGTKSSCIKSCPTFNTRIVCQLIFLCHLKCRRSPQRYVCYFILIYFFVSGFDS